MGVFAGPELASNLVFVVDMSNTEKSWKGEPTTNVEPNGQLASGWAVANYLTSAATIAFETESGIPHLKISNVTVDSGYPRIEPSANLTSTITDGFSCSFEAKGTPGSKVILALYSAGSTKLSLQANLTSDWQRFTYNNQTTGFTLDKCYIRIDNNTAGDIRYIRKIQVEQKTYSTPYVNGTRTANQALLDVAGQNTISANSLTYASNNTFSFNGTSNYLTTSLASVKTIEAWVRSSDVENRGIIYGPNANGNDNWFSIVSSKLSILFTELIDVNNATLTCSTTLANNTWYHVAAVIDTNSVKGYVNGLLDGSASPAFTVALWSGAASIGRRGNASQFYFNGNIDNVRVYNRILSADEIKNNFEAQRFRYNV